MKPYTFYMPTQVTAGAGCLAELAACAGRFRRPAILCGHRSARDSGALDAAVGHLPGALVLDGFPGDPDTAACERYAEKGRAAGIDAVVGLGGGSVLDGAKAIALLVANGGRCDDYFGAANLPHAPLPVIAIPTTAGTGSEVTPYAVLVDPGTRKKKTLKRPGLFPVRALLDPELTVTLPPAVTVETGLDALSQGMEGMLSLKSTPPGDVLALETCRRVYGALPRVLRDPDDLDARESLLHAAMLSGMVIAQSGTTLVHGMGYYYTLEYGVAHGAANALLLPPVFLWNAWHAPQPVASLAGALGYPCAAEPDAAGEAVVSALYEFYENIEFRCAARDHGIPQEASARIADDIIQDPYRFKNQVGELTRATVARLYEGAWRGDAVSLWNELRPEGADSHP